VAVLTGFAGVNGEVFQQLLMVLRTTTGA